MLTRGQLVDEGEKHQRCSTYPFMYSLRPSGQKAIDKSAFRVISSSFQRKDRSTVPDRLSECQKIYMSVFFKPKLYPYFQSQTVLFAFATLYYFNLHTCSANYHQFLKITYNVVIEIFTLDKFSRNNTILLKRCS